MYYLTLLSQGCVLNTAPSAGTVDRMYIPRTGRGKEPLIAWVQLSVNWQRSCPLDNLLLRCAPSDGTTVHSLVQLHEWDPRSHLLSKPSSHSVLGTVRNWFR